MNDKNLIGRLSAEIDRIINNNRELIETTDTDNINVRTFEARENLVNELFVLSASLKEVSSKIESSLSKARQSQSRELAVMDALIKKRTNGSVNIPSYIRGYSNNQPAPPPIQQRVEQIVKKKSEETWTTVVRKKGIIMPKLPKSYVEAATEDSPSRSYSDINHPQSPEPAKNIIVKPSTSYTDYSRVNFTDALYLNAIRVPSFDYIKQDGNLYYVEPADHFAIKIAGQLLHGNIGTIYTDEKSPEKIKDCKFGVDCMKRDKCDYYHCPLLYHGSRDHRNFIASSWLYAPPNSQYKNKSRSRRFGSREHLDGDIVNLSEEERTRYADMCMNDLLCTLLLRTAYARTP